MIVYNIRNKLNKMNMKWKNIEIKVVQIKKKY